MLPLARIAINGHTPLVQVAHVRVGERKAHVVRANLVVAVQTVVANNPHTLSVDMALVWAVGHFVGDCGVVY